MREKYPYILGAALLLIALFWFLPDSEELDSAGIASSQERQSDRSRSTAPLSAVTKSKPDQNQVEQTRAAKDEDTGQGQHASSGGARTPVDIDQQILRRAGGADPADPLPAGRASTNLRVLLRATGTRSVERVAGLESRREPGALNPEEREAGYEFLVDHVPPDNITRPGWHWVADELITTLRVDGTDQPRLARQLAAISSETGRDMILRDYTLQHLGHLRAEGKGDLAAIDAALHAATKEKKGTLAGTALLALNQYSDDIGGTALSIARDPSIDLRSRLTALQVAGKQGNQDSLPLAIEIAGSSTQPVALRMAAIATLGDLGATDQQVLLRQLSRSRDSRLRTAAIAALSTFSDR